MASYWPSWISGLLVAALAAAGGLTYLRLLFGARDIAVRRALIAGLYLMLVTGVAASFVLPFSAGVTVGESGMVEWATFWVLLGASICFAVVAWRSRSRHLNLLAVFGVLFTLFVAGEEVAWGQHSFHFTPPQIMLDHNRQEELTLHNLEIAGAYLGSWTQSLGPLVLFGGLLLWQLVFPDAARRRAGFDFNRPVAGLLLIVAALMLVSSYPHESRVVAPIPLSAFPRAIFTMHDSTQSEMSELLFAGAILFGALAMLSQVNYPRASSTSAG